MVEGSRGGEGWRTWKRVRVVAPLVGLLMLVAACGVDEPPGSTVGGTVTGEDATAETLVADAPSPTVAGTSVDDVAEAELEAARAALEEAKAMAEESGGDPFPDPEEFVEERGVLVQVSALLGCDEVAAWAGGVGLGGVDVVVEGVVAAYGEENPDSFGGMWVERESGVLVVALTDDPVEHREAILARLGDSSDVGLDVVRVRYARAELEAMRQQIASAASGRDFGQLMVGMDLARNRVTLGLFDPPEGALSELAELVPDRAAVCTMVSYPPRSPSGPLDVIPEPEDGNPLVTCPGIGHVRYWHLAANRISVDDVGHPDANALRAELDAADSEPLPPGRWVVIGIDDDIATFAAQSSDGFGFARFVRSSSGWVLDPTGPGLVCEPTVTLPTGLNRVEVGLDPNSPPNPENTTLGLLVTEAACANGREMGDALRDPQVVETDTAVLVGFVAVPGPERVVNCPTNPTTPVSVELSEPLGQRIIYDGLYYPPKPLGPAGFVKSAAGYRFSCGLRTDGTVACWGDNISGQTEPPDGQFTSLSAGSSQTCGIRTDSSRT